MMVGIINLMSISFKLFLITKEQEDLYELVMRSKSKLQKV